MEQAERKTALFPSVGADDEQLPLSTIQSIPAESGDCNSFSQKTGGSLTLLPDGYLNTVTLNELLDTDCPEKDPIIDGLLYRGTYLFTGAPKVGKSFLMAQLAYHVSTGTPLWGYPVRKGKVLYLALEDSMERLQSRLSRMFGWEGSDDFHLTVAAGALKSKLEKQLIRFLTDQPDTSLVIIDTLKRIRDDGDNASGTYSYDDDYDTILKLKNFADRREICLIIVHHNRKLRSEDIFEMISGTNGLFGAADGAFVLDKEKRGSDEAALYVTGRDQPDAKLQLKRNPGTLVWELVGGEIDNWKEPSDPVLDAVAALVSEDRTVWQGTPTELVNAINTELSANALSRKLNASKQRLLNDHHIQYIGWRIHECRQVRLVLQPRDDSDGRDDILPSGGGI